MINIAEGVVAGYIAARVASKALTNLAKTANDTFYGRALNLFTGIGKGAEGAASTTNYTFESVATVLWLLLVPLFLAALALAYY